MPESEATIAAIATPPGQGGIGVIRLSGPRALPIASALFRPSRPGAQLRSHRMVHGTVADQATGTVLDEVLVCLMRGPRSFTGEDVVEFHCHGSPVALQRILGCCLGQGARPAERGEFTLRAFLNGRIDLAQAESVIDLVQARTPTAAQVAAQGVTGALARGLDPAIGTITGALAYLEATIDFVEEDLPQHAGPQLLATLGEAEVTIAALLARAGHGTLIRDGVRVVLAGKPNVGKSSLLNALLRRDRAIVTPIPGTTRDTLEEAADIHGLPMFLVDTAGLVESEDVVERLGIARGTEALRHAAIILLIVDGSRQPDDADRRAALAVRDTAPRTPLLLAVNKCDLPDGAPVEAYEALLAGTEPAARLVRCSADRGAGLSEIEDILADLALGGEALDAGSTLVERPRQRQALEEAAAALAAARTGLRVGRAPELVCIDLRAALEALGGVTGQDVGEAVLDRLFGEFCIGK